MKKTTYKKPHSSLLFLMVTLRFEMEHKKLTIIKSQKRGGIIFYDFFMVSFLCSFHKPYLTLETMVS